MCFLCCGWALLVGREIDVGGKERLVGEIAKLGLGLLEVERFDSLSNWSEYMDYFISINVDGKERLIERD